MKFNDIDCIKTIQEGCLLYYSNGQTQKINVSPTQMISNLCKKFKGLQLKQFYNYKSPYYLDHMLFQPTKSTRKADCEYINMLHILKINKLNYGSLLHFANHTIFVDLTPKILYKYLNLNILFKLRIEMSLSPI